MCIVHANRPHQTKTVADKRPTAQNGTTKRNMNYSKLEPLRDLIKVYR